MIRVDVFSTIEKPWFRTIDSIDKFLEGDYGAEMWTEDLYFCDKVTKAGWKILADGGILPNHWDTKSGRPWNLPPTSKPLVPVALAKGTKKIVDLGSGPPEESYSTNEGEVLRVDVREDAKPDFRCDVRRTPFATGEFDIVFSSHTLEHFARNEVGAILDEWVRIMKPEGEMRLLLPNMEWAAQHIMNKEIDKDVMNVLYGAQSYDENFHKTGFTSQMVEQLLAERGFTHFEWDYENYHMFVRAFKKIPEGGVPALGCVSRMGEQMNHPMVNSAPDLKSLALDPAEIMRKDAAVSATVAPSEVMSYADEPVIPDFVKQ
jgi:predicted SAM-dependent methyltransferase